MISMALTMSGAILFPDISPTIVSIGPFALRWYSMAYIVGIIAGWYYLGRVLQLSRPPMTSQHLADLATWVIIGVIVGGRLFYVLFYDFPVFMKNPFQIFMIWQGGMSFHGGMVGVATATLLYCWSGKLSAIRVLDYICCAAPIGLGLGRLANFINYELWGSKTDLPWGVIFPGQDIPRHPSQIYEALLEGLVLFFILRWMMYKSDARLYPGRIGGAFLLCYGFFRFMVEFVRMPDSQLADFAQRSGLSMGQWLSVPMIILGIYFIVTSKNRSIKL